MESDSLHRISALYHSARALPLAERAAFLAKACGPDEAVRREVESLLAQPTEEEFLREPAAVMAAQLATGSELALLTGRRLGSYEIQALIGVGGMGEVYRARDTRLGRDVAIKVLPRAFTNSPDRLARFEREARALAALNHPHVAAIYGVEETDGIRALVLELVEGETLAKRLLRSRRGLSIDEVLTIARQLADALEGAHEKGIVHRDLKPSNIAFTSSGAVKVLDFGLAKLAPAAIGDDGESGEQASSPARTREGLVVGTASYMSPEQARGQPVDKRTDVWAFGCVLYEMLTGRIAFCAPTISDTVGAVLEREPDWNALPDAVAPSIRRLLRRCLEKDRRRRLHDIADARIEMEESGIAFTSDPTEMRIRRWRAWAVAGGCFLVGAAVAGIFAIRETSRPDGEWGRNVVTFAIRPPEKTEITSSNFALSPDGRQLVWAATADGGVTRLWIQPLDSQVARELRGTEGASLPFWSPDSRAIGFFVENTVKRVDVSGGSVQSIANTSFASSGASWNSNDVIVFSTRYGLYQVAANGGDASLVAEIDRSRQEESLRFPQFLPDGRRFLYIARSGRRENSSAYVGSVDRPTKPTRLFTVASKVEYASGHLLFVQDGSLMARPFDPEKLSVGEPFTVAEKVGQTPQSLTGFFSSSSNGVLAFRSSVAQESVLRWFDRSGKPLESLGQPALYMNFRVAPDGKRLATALIDGSGNRSVWILENDAPPLRLTFSGIDEWQPVWSPDADRIVFGSYRNGPFSLYVKSSTGSGGEDQLLMASENALPQSWSRGGFLAYFLNREMTRRDIFVLPLGSESRESIPIAQSEADEHSARFSPDGRWIAYVSNETGRLEVYVQPFPPNAGRWQVSVDGGDEPAWSADGRELFYLGLDGLLTTVSVTATGPTFRVSSPKPLFRTGRPLGAPFNRYDVSPDGRRFLILSPASPPPPPEPITVLVNWIEHSKQRTFSHPGRQNTP